MTTTDPLDAWYRTAVAETMRPCPEYRNGPAPMLLTIEELDAAQHRRALLDTWFGDRPSGAHLKVA